jgi:quercetin dioxygenase-like cupin family protein
MERWHLPSIEADGKREPRVLFSRPECRGVLIDLRGGEDMGEHRVHEHTVVLVVSGRLSVESDDQGVECEPGTAITFAPGQSRSLRALETARILLVLSPWPGDGHYGVGEDADPARMPAQATASPLSS